MLLNNQFIQSLSNSFVQNLQATVYPKLEDLGTWSFERLFTPYNVSHVTCHMSGVMCQVSGVKCQGSCVLCQIKFCWFDKFVELVGWGSVINEAYPVLFHYLPDQKKDSRCVMSLYIPGSLQQHVEMLLLKKKRNKTISNIFTTKSHVFVIHDYKCCNKF